MNSCLKLTPSIEPTPLPANYGGKITGFDKVSQSFRLIFSDIIHGIKNLSM